MTHIFQGSTDESVRLIVELQELRVKMCKSGEIAARDLKSGSGLARKESLEQFVLDARGYGRRWVRFADAVCNPEMRTRRVMRELPQFAWVSSLAGEERVYVSSVVHFETVMVLWAIASASIEVAINSSTVPELDEAQVYSHLFDADAALGDVVEILGEKWTRVSQSAPAECVLHVAKFMRSLCALAINTTYLVKHGAFFEMGDGARSDEDGSMASASEAILTQCKKLIEPSSRIRERKKEAAPVVPFEMVMRMRAFSLYAQMCAQLAVASFTLRNSDPVRAKAYVDATGETRVMTRETGDMKAASGGLARAFESLDGIHRRISETAVARGHGRSEQGARRVARPFSYYHDTLGKQAWSWKDE